MALTNRGKFLILQGFLKGTVPTNFYLALGTTAPTVDTNTLGEMTQIGTGTGYSDGGISIARDGTDFPTLTEDDSSNFAEVVLKTETWNATGAGMSGMRYVYLTTDEGTVANRQIIAWHDLGAGIPTALSGQSFSVTAFTVRLSYASGWTNKGLARVLNVYFRGLTVPTYFYVGLWTSAYTPTDDTNTFSQGTEIATGNGYSTGGLQVTRDGTGFPSVGEDDANDWATATMKDLAFTASGGNIPASGNGASWAVFTDDNGTVGSREVLAFTTVNGPATVSNGNAINCNDWPFKLS